MTGLMKIEAGIIALVCMTGTGLAATSATKVAAPAKGPEVRSETSTSVVAPEQAKLPLSSTLISIFYGPPVSDPTSKTTADNGVNQTTDLSTQHLVGLSYKPNKHTSISPTLDFNYRLAAAEAGPNFTWNDIYLNVKRTGIIEKDIRGSKVALDSAIRYYAPTSKGSSTVKSLGSVRLSVEPSIQFAKSKFSLSFTNQVRYYLQTLDVNPQTERSLSLWRFYAGQQLNYQASSRVNAFVLYENDFRFFKNGHSDIAPTHSNADLEPGVEVTINDRISLSPYLNWYTNQKLNTTSINMAATIKLL